MTKGSPAGGPQRWKALRRFTIDITSLRESRDWRLLFLGQAVNVVGDQVRVVAVPYMVFLITRSPLVVGLVSLSQFAPTLFLALAGGNLADSMDRRRVLVISQVLFTGTSILLAVAALLGTPPLWYIFVVVTAAAGIEALEHPARRAAIPRLVGRGQVANAMALDQVTFQLGSVLGPAVGGVLLARFGVGPALLFSTGTCVLALLAVVLVAPMPPEARRDAAARSGVAAIREGLGYIKGKPVILSIFLIDLNAMLFGMPTALFPALATQVFKTGPVGLGLLYAAPGTGALLGALVTGWVSRVRRQGRAVLIAVCVWGAAITAFGLLPHAFWLALIMLAIAGSADMFSTVFRSTILQLGVPDRLRGRLSAVNFLVVTSGPRLGDMEAGSVAAVAGTRFSVISGGIAAVVGAIVIALAMPVFARYDAGASAGAMD